MVQLEVEVAQDLWRPVLQYDCAHACVHKDRYNLHGEQDKEALSLNYADVLTFADQDINNNWPIYRE